LWEQHQFGIALIDFSPAEVMGSNLIGISDDVAGRHEGSKIVNISVFEEIETFPLQVVQIAVFAEICKQ
jgi:hypothetical protein